MQMSMTELRSDWLIGFHVLERDKFSAKTISINKFSSERVSESKSFYGRWRLQGMGSGLAKLDVPWLHSFESQTEEHQCETKFLICS